MASGARFRAQESLRGAVQPPHRRRLGHRRCPDEGQGESDGELRGLPNAGLLRHVNDLDAVGLERELEARGRDRHRVALGVEQDGGGAANDVERAGRALHGSSFLGTGLVGGRELPSRESLSLPTAIFKTDNYTTKMHFCQE